MVACVIAWMLCVGLTAG